MSDDSSPESSPTTPAKFDIGKARDRMADSMFAYINNNVDSLFDALTNPLYAPALDYAGGIPARAPLYEALHSMAGMNNINEDSAPKVAMRVGKILQEIEDMYGKAFATKVGNTICHAYNDDNFRRPVMGTIRDILEAKPDLTAYFSPVIKRFQLLRQSDVLKEQLPRAERISDRRFTDMMKDDKQR